RDRRFLHPHAHRAGGGDLPLLDLFQRRHRPLCRPPRRHNPGPRARPPLGHLVRDPVLLAGGLPAHRLSRGAGRGRGPTRDLCARWRRLGHLVCCNLNWFQRAPGPLGPQGPLPPTPNRRGGTRPARPHALPPDEAGVFAGLKASSESVAIPLSVFVAAEIFLPRFGYQGIFTMLAINIAIALVLLLALVRTPPRPALPPEPAAA